MCFFMLPLFNCIVMFSYSCLSMLMCSDNLKVCVSMQGAQPVSPCWALLVNIVTQFPQHTHPSYLVLAQEPVVLWRVLHRRLGSSAGGDSLRFLVDFLKPAGLAAAGEEEEDTSGGLREATSSYRRSSRRSVFYGGKFGTFGEKTLCDLELNWWPQCNTGWLCINSSRVTMTPP